MQALRWSCADLVEALAVPGEPDVAGFLIVVEAGGAGPPPERVAAAVERLGTLPCVIVGSPGPARARGQRGPAVARVGSPGPARASDLLDAEVAGDDELDAITVTYGRAPLASAALALHLRASERRAVADGLVAESALYSALQAGPEHQAWRVATPVRHRTGDDGDWVRVERSGAELRITLTRPAARNALDVVMRDGLLDALAVAEADPSLRVVLRGEGPVFCAGGDLDEFGSAPDPATAHVVRLRRSIAAVLHRLAGRTAAHVQGACAGSGVELPAFAGRVVADPGATFSLPELGLGLIPGAGGTVSLPRRIGRQRTAWLALTGRPVDAVTARSWGLVDEIVLAEASG